MIIVGAGPAGGQCARELSALGYKVLLLERSKIIGEPNFSSGGTTKETITDFDLPNKVIQRSWNALTLVSKNERLDLKYRKTVGYVLDYKTLKQFLTQEAKRNGATVLKGAVVKEPIFENSIIKGVKFNNTRAYGDVVIDATGNTALLSSKLGIINDRGPKKRAIGLEYLVSNSKMDNNNSLQFYFGEKYAPNGYLWVFPIGGNSAKVGLAQFGVVNPAAQKPKLDRFMESNRQTKRSKIKDTHGGQIIFGWPSSFVKSNTIAIGDSGGQCNPLGGEGIRHALLSGKFAAKVTAKYLSSKKRRLSTLKEYDSLWKRYVGRRWKISFYLAFFIYSHLSDQNADKLIRFCRKLQPNDIVNLLFYYNFSKISRYFPIIAKAAVRYNT